jgi:hypothetical protein
MKKIMISGNLQKEVPMTDPRNHRLFQWLDRAFWLIWLGFPVMIWLLVQSVLDAPAQLLALAPEQATCLAELPLPSTFSPTGQWVFWLAFAVEMVMFAALLAMAHAVIHRCATGQVFVSGMIGTLHRIGLLIVGFPVVDLVLQNLTLWVYVQTGDVPTFSADFALDLPVIGVGLLLITIAAAMRMAVQLHQDAELTI